MSNGQPERNIAKAAAGGSDFVNSPAMSPAMPARASKVRLVNSMLLWHAELYCSYNITCEDRRDEPKRLANLVKARFGLRRSQ